MTLRTVIFWLSTATKLVSPLCIASFTWVCFLGISIHTPYLHLFLWHNTCSTSLSPAWSTHKTLSWKETNKNKIKKRKFPKLEFLCQNVFEPLKYLIYCPSCARFIFIAKHFSYRIWISQQLVSLKTHVLNAYLQCDGVGDEWAFGSMIEVRWGFVVMWGIPMIYVLIKEHNISLLPNSPFFSFSLSSSGQTKKKS